MSVLPDWLLKHFPKAPQDNDKLRFHAHDYVGRATIGCEIDGHDVDDVLSGRRGRR
jgi:hypothetical protein